MTASDDRAAKIKGIDAGADNFITKPPNKMELVARTKSFIKLKRPNDNLASIEYVLFSLGKTVEGKDEYTKGHVERVSKLAILLGNKLDKDVVDKLIEVVSDDLRVVDTEFFCKL